jgi:hypothetical protein
MRTPTDDHTHVGEIDVSNPMLGSLRTRGYRLMDLVCLISLGLMGWACTMLYNHNADAKDDSKSVAQVLKESNKEIAGALKEATRENAEAMKAFAVEQRRMTQAIRESNCLLDPAMRNRPDAREFCKRMAQDR